MAMIPPFLRSSFTASGVISRCIGLPKDTRQEDLLRTLALGSLLSCLARYCYRHGHSHFA